jgi:hypothetical protein
MFKLDRKQLDEIPQFAVEPEHFRLLGVRFKYPMLGTPMPADISKRVYSDYGPDLSAADNNVLVLVRDAARLAHVPPKERGLLLYDDMSPYCISGLQREGKCESTAVQLHAEVFLEPLYVARDQYRYCHCSCYDA